MARIQGTAGTAPPSKPQRAVVQPNPDQRVPSKPAPHPPVRRPIPPQAAPRQQLGPTVPQRPKVFNGPSTATKPFARQQTQAQQRVDRATRQLPVRPLAAPPVPATRRVSSAPLSRGEVQSFVSIKSPRGQQLQAGHEQIVQSLRRQLGNTQGRQRVNLIGQILHEVNTDPRYAAVRRSIRYYSLGQQAMITPEARATLGRDTIKPGPQPTRAHLGVGPLEATVNLSALGGAIGHGIAAVTPGLQGGTPEEQFARNALSDVGSLGVGPFVGGYAVGDIAVTAATGHPGRAARKAVALGKAIATPLVEQVRHPGSYFVKHPLLSALNIAGAESALGRTGGSVARAVGRKGATGVRGALDEHSHVVRPPLSMTNDAGVPAPRSRSYSKDLFRRAEQVDRDKRRAPLRDAHGNVVTVEDRGRQVPVLQSSPGEQERLGKSRADFHASRGNMRERRVRDEATKASKVTGVRGAAAKDIVAMATEGTITSAKHFEQDLRAHRAKLAARIQRHESGAELFRHSGDLEAARNRLALVDRVLSSPKAMAAAQRIVAEGERHGRRLNAGDTENAAAGLIDAKAAKRSALSVTALEHMGARHFTVEEHQALERDAGKAEKAAADRYEAAKTPAERAQAVADLHAAREHRIAVSGREPVAVRAHEDANAQLAVAQAQSKAAHAAEEAQTRKITALVAGHRSERGREAHHGPVAAYHVNGQRFTLRQDAVAYAKAHSFPLTDVQRVATTAGEARRVGELSNARRALGSIKARRRAADKAIVKAQRAVKDNPRPETKAALRYGEGNPTGKPAGAHLPNKDIEAFLRSRGRDPESVAYLPHRQDVVGARAHHARATPGQRPVLDAGETRTGEAYRSGVTESSRRLLHDQGVRQKVLLNKAQQLDRLVADNGLRHPAWSKAQRGEKLTPGEQRIVDKGGLFTAREASEFADRLERDKGQRLTPMRAYNSSLSTDTKRLIREDFQGPGGMETLPQHLLNDRIVKPGDTIDPRARNVVLVPSAMVDRLEAHLRPAGEIEKFFQYLNRPFRMAVLPQPRWLTGNFAEAQIVRLGVKGSGVVNVFGLGVDMLAARRGLAALDKGTAEMRRAAEEIRAQQTGAGLFIGGRGANVHRTAEEVLPAAAQRAYGHMVAKLPVVAQMTEMTRSAVHWIAAPLNFFFEFNRRAIESPAQRAAFGHQFREDMQAVTGSWVKTITLSKQAVADAAKGLVNTPAQHRFMLAQHELLGKYAGFSPRTRAIVQSVAPFLPWAMNAARFVYWTMPAHHSALTALLVQTNQAVQKDWTQIHSDTPPGDLRDAIPNGKGGWIDIARYTPYGLTEPIVRGDVSGLTSEFIPQLSGVQAAVQGRDPFGNDLKVRPTAANPQGKPSGGQRVGIALNQGLEAMVPYLAQGRRLLEHGETAYANSTILSPKTKPGTSHGMSGLRRTFDPLRPTYLRSSGGETVVQPKVTGRPQRRQPTASTDPWDHVQTQQPTQTQAASPWDLVK